MKKIINYLFILIASMSTAYGQTLSLSGVIKDSEGFPLIGATVQVENTSKATVTNLDGFYTLEEVPVNAKLVFSYVGMLTQKIGVNNRTVIDVLMKENISELEEFIVIGYGTTTKRKSVGAVSMIESDKLVNTAFSNVQSALQGQVPGLIIQSSGGGVNDLPSVSIRGGGSPLYVIDGIISDEQAFAMLNSDDIESISFLKDAASTAVYGSQAGDGIVQVKTKRGNKGTPVVAYSGSVQFGSPTMIPERLSSKEYMEMRNVVSMREEGHPTYTPDQFALIGKDYLFPDNDWYDILFKNYSVSNKHNLSVSGGNENSEYYVSLGNYATNGLLENNLETLNRTNFRSNVNTHFDKINLGMSTGISASIQKTKEPPYKDYMGALYTATPLTRGLNPDGTLSDALGNPLQEFSEESGYSKWDKQNLSTFIDLDWKPKFIDGLSLGAKGAYTRYNHFNRKWDVAPEMYSWDPETESSSLVGMLQQPNMGSRSGYTQTIDFEGRIGYVKTIKKHTIDVLGLYTQRNTFSDFVSASRSKYYSAALDQISAGPIEGMGSDGYSAEGASAGLVFRGKYDFDSKYIIEFSGRYDGNDNFAPDQRWGFFPSVSGVWIISDEKFMQILSEKNILNFLKLRGSYGVTGITKGTTRFGYISSYTYTNSYYTVGDKYVNTFKEGPLVDADNLSWYTRKSSNIGFDAMFLGRKLEASFDYFYYVTTGYLCSPANRYITTLGTALPKITSDTEHRRAGYELNLRYKDSAGDWSWAVGCNAVYYSQLYAQLDTESPTQLQNPYTRKTHQTDYFTATLIADGLFQTTEEILNSPQPIAANVTQKGEVKYYDANGDGKIDDNDKRRFEGSNHPHFMYGIDFSVSYKNLSLSGLLQGTGDYYAWMGNRFSQSTTKSTLTKFGLEDRYSESNPNAKYPILSNSETYNGGNNSQKSSLYFDNARYLRLKNIQLSYDLKADLLRNVDFIKGFSIVLSATNLFTISKVMKYMDPEQALATVKDYDSANSIAGDGSPMSKTYSLGVNVKF